MSCHIWNRKMASHLCEFLQAFSNYQFLYFTYQIGTGKRLFSCVGHFMSLQITILAECLVTFGTGKWLLSCVGPFMDFHFTICFKCLNPLGTGKWLLSCVDPFMPFQSTTFSK